MKIEYLGHSCFSIENEAGIKVITDPYSRVGYELPKNVSAQIVTVSHNHFDHNHAEGIQGNPLIISSTGKYNAYGVEIEGYQTWHDQEDGRLRGENIMFTIKMDGITICHFGDLGEMNIKKIQSIVKDADIWLIPVGGTYTIDAKQACAYIEQLSPKMVIPMHYRPNDGNLDISTIDKFFDAYLKQVCNNPNSLMVEKKNLLDGETKVILMERKK